MAYAAMKPTKAGLEDAQEQIHKIRITLSSKNVKNLEKGISFHQFLKQVDFLFFMILYSNSCVVCLLVLRFCNVFRKYIDSSKFAL